MALDDLHNQQGQPASRPVPASQRRFAPVYALLERAVVDGVFPGCAFGVMDGRGVSFCGAVGRQTYAVDSPVIYPDSVYDLASLTKVVATTAMAMLLYQRQLLEPDTPIVQWLPEFLQGTEQRAAVTMRHLLAHSSGLAGYARLFEVCFTPEALWQACLAMPLEATPGTRTEYSDIGFILLGRILERIAGGSIETFCQREIFLPLGMKTTGFNPEASKRSAIPPTEDDRTFRHRVIQGEVQDENCFVLGGVSGHAGLFGNTEDLLRFAEAVLFPGDGRLFTSETIEVFSRRAELPPGSSRALGWDTPSPSSSGTPSESGAPSSSGTMFSKRSIGHLGYAGTSLWIDRGTTQGTDQTQLHNQPCAVVLLTNRTWPTRENQKIRQLRPAFHDAVRQCLLDDTS